MVGYLFFATCLLQINNVEIYTEWALYAALLDTKTTQSKMHWKCQVGHKSVQTHEDDAKHENYKFDTHLHITPACQTKIFPKGSQLWHWKTELLKK